jgi:hypothetical protein
MWEMGPFLMCLCSWHIREYVLARSRLLALAIQEVDECDPNAAFSLANAIGKIDWVCNRTLVCGHAHKSMSDTKIEHSKNSRFPQRDSASQRRSGAGYKKRKPEKHLFFCVLREDFGFLLTYQGMAWKGQG